jgi:hypothetical protein
MRQTPIKRGTGRVVVALLGLVFLKAFGDGYVWTGGIPGREASGLEANGLTGPVGEESTPQPRRAADLEIPTLDGEGTRIKLPTIGCAPSPAKPSAQ